MSSRVPSHARRRSSRRTPTRITSPSSRPRSAPMSTIRFRVGQPPAPTSSISFRRRPWTSSRRQVGAGTKCDTPRRCDGGYKPEDLGVSVSGAVSREPDYLSLSGGGGVSWELAQKTVTPHLDYSFGHDTAGRTGTPFSVYSLTMNRHTLSAGVELLLDRETVVTLGMDAILESGHQEKPYRFRANVRLGRGARTSRPGASVERVNALRLARTCDARALPTTRQRFAFSARLAQRLSDSTFIVSERCIRRQLGTESVYHRPADGVRRVGPHCTFGLTLGFTPSRAHRFGSLPTLRMARRVVP